MTLQDELARLKNDLEQKRKQLEEHITESTLSRARTSDLAEKLRQLGDRIAITAEQSTSESAPAVRSRHAQVQPLEAD